MEDLIQGRHEAKETLLLQPIPLGDAAEVSCSGIPLANVRPLPAQTLSQDAGQRPPWIDIKTLQDLASTYFSKCFHARSYRPSGFPVPPHVCP